MIMIRHRAEFTDRLDCDLIGRLLAAVPDSLEVEARLHWLRQFVPDVLQLVPGSLPVIAGWAVEAVKKLELGRRREWPANGRHFASEILETMHFVAKSGNGGSDFTEFLTLLTLNQERSDISKYRLYYFEMFYYLKNV